jgi:hypothetical protein
MGWFFTKAAMMTFGGAYAVLPYVVQGARRALRLAQRRPQMIDGLALGETTPGPLIMIVAFVGFVGGWTHALFGRPRACWPAIAGAGGGGPVHLPALLRLHPGRRPAGRVDARQRAHDGAADRDLGGGGRRDRQPGGVLRQPGFFAGGRPHWAGDRDRRGACIALLRYKAGTIPLIARLCACRPRAIVLACLKKSSCCTMRAFAAMAIPATLEAPTGLLADALGRPLHDLRISVTDRCNFRCVYCMPKEVFDKDYAYLPHSSLLSFEEITRWRAVRRPRRREDPPDRRRTAAAQEPGTPGGPCCARCRPRRAARST